MRRLLLGILVVVLAGTATDLMLLAHHEDPWQMVPLVLIGVALVAAAACALSGRRESVLLLRGLMALFIGAGLLGMAMHYNGNLEFQRELDPAQAGWPLFVKVITAKAPPALAPAVMIQMGWLGLLYTYQHPALGQRTRRSGLDTSSGV